jgi:acyl-CoA-binding protein
MALTSMTCAVQSLQTRCVSTQHRSALAGSDDPRAATEGDVTSRRPGMLDMLGRAKW